MYVIECKDIVANAFIQSDKNFLRFTEIEKYENDVVELLNEKTELLVSRYYKDKLLQDYSDFFTESNEGIKLKSNKTKDDLICEFRGYLPINLLTAFAEIRVF